MGGPSPLEGLAAADPYRPEWVLDADVPPLLRTFNQSGVLAPADVHTALRLARMAGEDDEDVILAAALAVRGPRVGHVSVDLAAVSTSAVVGEDDIDVDGLPWPAPDSWVARVAASPLTGTDPGEDRPLRMAGRSVYLDRYWRDETGLAADLLSRAAAGDVPGAGGVGAGDAPGAGGAADAPGPWGSGPPTATLDVLFPPGGADDQREAAVATGGRRLTVLAGGPGTGKTTTVARLLVLLCEEASAAGRRLPLIALAAPTGKAAARMAEAVRLETARVATGEATADLLSRLGGTTIHRLLGTRPDRPGRFRHHAGHHLPHDVVVVDEASMVSLSLMARLVEAVRPAARLMLVGDPDQLVSVEAGAVLADIVGPARAAGVSGPMSAAISVLRTNHRFGGRLARLADAVRDGDAESALAALDASGASAPATCSWADAEPGEWLFPAGNPPSSGPLADVAGSTLAWAADLRESARAGDVEGALAALGSHRLLCAHRHGPAGVSGWNSAVTGWLPGGVPGGEWFAGRPVMVTANDYSLRLFNGDAGVAVTSRDAGDPGSFSLRVAFPGGAEEGGLLHSPYRLEAVETVYAMTVHKSQGSEFDHVTLLLPPASSRLLTRELLYTAVTRARRSVRVVGTEAALRVAIGRPAARASGLVARLWGGVADIRPE